MIDYRLESMQKNIDSLDKQVKEHDERLDKHDIKFTEHTKDFEKLNETIIRLNNTMEEFIRELREMKEAPIKSSQYFRRLIISTIVTASLGLVLGIIFGQNV